ncbi:MAG: efflux transporter periplasmic adaptor subunit [Alphaproteobacteria bacterium]|nr:efflux transporter periplasmic adaptor subunit [Alphaproteobacteria bacterium]HCP01428.1 efflux RND transporter periplasmic adaptor subunit [Rhodospirillaceae bacterium]
MRRSIITALILTAIGSAWIASGQFNKEQITSSPVSDSITKPLQRAMTQVRVVDLEAVMHVERVDLTGRTEASRKVQLRAETRGLVRELIRERGEKLEKGSPVARLRVDDRAAKLAEAQATLRQRQIEYDASDTLKKKGFRSETDAAAAKARLDAARAVVERMEIEIDRTTLRAPFDGTIVSGHVELGDYVQVGDIVATVVDLDPILVIGNVSEWEVNRLHEGMSGTVRLIDGSEHNGIIHFIALVAEAATRTYRVELEIPNPGGTIRDGITAEMMIPVTEGVAHFVSASTLTLNDNGVVGVKTLTPENIVTFKPVNIIADKPDGIWIGGLPPNIRLITVGQEFVLDGEQVQPVVDRALDFEAVKT